MTPTEKLLAIEEIRHLKARYFRFLDSHDWAGFRSLFADDATFALPKPPVADNAADLFEAGDEISGADAFVAWASGRLDGVHSAHLGYMPEIDILSETEAKAVWGMEDILRSPRRVVHGYGYYKERYVCQAGVWRIKRWELYYKSMEVTDLSHTGSRIVTL
jgi:hypothetical protein